MARIKGSKNKPKPVSEGAFKFTLEQRMRIIADLIVDKIREDQDFGRQLIKVLDTEPGDVSKS
jgi:hypothetical protein